VTKVDDYTIIGNPKAGQGHGAKVLRYVVEDFARRGISHISRSTDGPGHATELARASKSNIVVAVGGDGTINEVANGLIGTDKTLGIVPAGSGNDFIKSVNVPKQPAGAIDLLFRGKIREIDAGVVKTSRSRDTGETSESIGRYFANGVGVGFDAAVAARTKEIRFLTGLPLYLLAVFQTLGKYRAPLFDMLIDGEARRSENLLIAIGNGPCAGGGFYLTPDAVVDDGMFDMCLIDSVATTTILRLLPLVLIARHRNAKQVKFLKFKKLSLKSSIPFYVHADGEIIGQDVSSVEIEIKPKALRVICG
jgi:YegS/Rv2252/BmrU family lipid kinase